MAVAAVTTVAAVAAACSARRSARSAAAMAANDAARRHEDLAPRIELRARQLHGDRAELLLTLIGPDTLGGVDTLRVRVDDEHDQPRTPVTVGSYTQEELDAQIWGPYRLTPTGPGDDRRTLTLTDVGIGARRPLALERTTAPPWSDPEWWRHTYDGAPVFVTLTCHRDGHEPWSLPRRRVDVV
ncbi:hypothetical protein A6A08_21375 [Nocardiopsis sp. TSRI0078]|nr:hypothetical protein A6A08_21375 [Nocardiopsis sp. TSRI0078]